MIFSSFQVCCVHLYVERQDSFCLLRELVEVRVLDEEMRGYLNPGGIAALLKRR